MKIQTLLILNLLLQNIQKFHINYPRLLERVKELGSNSSLCSNIKKVRNKRNERNKQIHTFKNFSNTYNVEILNFSIAELKLKDSESTIKSKLIELLTRLKGFEFATTLVLVFKKIRKNDKKDKKERSMIILTQAQKQKK